MPNPSPAELVRYCQARVDDGLIEGERFPVPSQVGDLGTLRGVKRLINRFWVHYDALAGEVHAGDLFTLLMLRELDPDLFERLAESRERLVDLSDYQADSKWFAEVLQGHEPVRQLVLRLFPRAQAIYNYLAATPESLREARARRRICAGMFFDRYLRLGVAKSEVGESEFLETMQLTEGAFQARLGQLAGEERLEKWLERAMGVQLPRTQQLALIASLDQFSGWRNGVPVADWAAFVAYRSARADGFDAVKELVSCTPQKYVARLYGMIRGDQLQDDQRLLLTQYLLDRCQQLNMVPPDPAEAADPFELSVLLAITLEGGVDLPLAYLQRLADGGQLESLLGAFRTDVQTPRSELLREALKRLPTLARLKGGGSVGEEIRSTLRASIGGLATTEEADTDSARHDSPGPELCHT